MTLKLKYVKERNERCCKVDLGCIQINNLTQQLVPQLQTSLCHKSIINSPAPVPLKTSEQYKFTKSVTKVKELYCLTDIAGKLIG